MPADIVNLNKARKKKARTDKEAKAAENRVRFGRGKAERNKIAAERTRVEKEIEGARRDSPPVSGDTGEKDA